MNVDKERSAPPQSAWSIMKKLPVDTESKNYDLTSHIADILEKQAVSQVDRLRCELAMRLQQINGRVDKALNYVGMSRFEAPVGPTEDANEQQSLSDKHFMEQKRRESFLASLKDHMVDSSHRTRLLEELYEWFTITKEYVVNDAMMNTLAAVAKIKRLGLKLLASSGYVDDLGRRRSPPKIIEERFLLADYGKNLDGALGVMRKCHEELSKMLKSPMLRKWIMSARKQMKNLSVAVVSSFIQHMKIQQENLALNKKINSLTNNNTSHDGKLSAMGLQLHHATQKIQDQKERMKEMEKLLMAAQQSDDYHQEKVLKLTDELESLSVAQPAKKSTPKEPDIDTATMVDAPLKLTAHRYSQTSDHQSGGSSFTLPGLVMIGTTSLNNMQFEIGRLKNELKETKKEKPQKERSKQEVTMTITDTPSVPRDDQDDKATMVDVPLKLTAHRYSQTSDHQSAGSSLAPPGLVMIEITSLNNMHSEIGRLKNELKETKKEKPQKERSKQDVTMTITDTPAVPRDDQDDKEVKADEKKEESLKAEIFALQEERDVLQAETESNKEKMAKLQDELTDSDAALQQRESHMEELQRRVIRNFQNFLPGSRKTCKGYDSCLHSVNQILDDMKDFLVNIHYDNKRMASYVRKQLDR
ncbi:putative uncharacterized protein MYH16 [Watersipora subatra]|uniref:putative uncharacterized protein MYH16 n=1 Tax=Watersipora subatra TaxID=2589382 RepID=UPI00355BFDF2